VTLCFYGLFNNICAVVITLIIVYVTRKKNLIS